MGSLRDRKVDLLSTAVLDFHGRQIKNASDGIDGGDYVTLRQLRTGLDSLKSGPLVQTPTGTVTSGNGATYILEVFGNLAIGVNLAGKRVITQSSKPTMVRFDLDSAPTGHDLGIDIYQNSVLWLSTAIPDGSSSFTVAPADVTAAGSLTAANYLRLDITAVGSTNPGNNLYCTITQ